jgi:hypothetical protein
MEPSQIVSIIVNIMNTALATAKDAFERADIAKKAVNALKQINTPGRRQIISYIECVYQQFP